MRIVIASLTILAMACIAQAGAITNTILIDFGEPQFIGVDPNGDPNANMTYLPSPEPPWNNMDGNQILALNDTSGAASGITAETDAWGTDGQGGMDANNLYVYEAQKDYVGVNYNANATVTLTGLTESEYTIVVFGSRDSGSWGAPMFRTGQFSVDGWANHQTQNHSGNTSIKTYFSDVAPVGGTIVLDVTGLQQWTGAAWLGYAYIDVMEILVPEPATLSLLALGGLVAIRRRRR